MTIYSPVADGFSDIEVLLLTNLAGDLAYGITTLRLRAAHAAAEAELRVREEQLRLFVEHAPAAIAMFDTQMRYIAASQHWLADFGVAGQDLRGRSHYAVFPEIPDRWREIHRRCLAGAVERADEDPFVRADGTVQWIRWEVRPWYAATGDVGGIIIFSEDITARKQAEAQLRLQTTALQAAANAIAIVDRHGVIQWVNEAFARLTGYSAAEAIGKNPRLLKSGQHPIEFYTGMWATVIAGRVWHGELINKRKDGRLYAEEMTITPVSTPAGAITHFIAIKQDITERRRAEEQIKASAAENEILLREIHHRVKNNLQVISSLVSLQSDTLADDGQRAVFDDVRDQVRTMALVHEKLYQTGDLARLNFAEYAESLMQYLWRAHGSKAANVQLKLAVAPVSLSAETAIPCGLILNELATNALKHGFPNGRRGTVTVALDHDPATGRVCLCVRDDGVGLPAGLDWQTSPSLGLRLVHMLASQLRGTAEIGPGTEFRITFSIKEDPR